MAEERPREATKDAMRVVEELSGVGTETISLWTDLAQRVTADTMRLSVNAAQEQMRQTAALQQSALEAWRGLQGLALRWQIIWPELFRDPMRWYQRAAEEGIASTQAMMGLARRNAEEMTQAFTRMENAAQQTTREMGETFKQAASKMQSVAGRADRLRAA
jgi:hypothetical protein